MRPKTSVRQPIIAGARRQHLSNMLRKWRRQPRKRSLLLFWAFLSLALLSDTLLVVLGVRFLGVSPSVTPPTERHIHVPYAADASLWEPLRHWVIRANGRTQLFESFCLKTVREITGEERFEERDPLAVVVSWMLDSEANALKWDDYPCLLCEDAELRAVLYHEDHSPARMSREEQLHGRYVEPSVVSSSPTVRKLLRGVRVKSGAGADASLSSLKRKASELQTRLRLFQQIRGGGVDAGSSAEMQTASAALREAYHSGEKDLFAAALNDFLDASRRAMRVDENPDDSRQLASEGWLNEHTPSRKAMVSSLLGAALFTAAAIARSRWPRWRRRFLAAGLLGCLGGLGWGLEAIVYGAIREGSAPVSDGTQGMLWISFLSLGLSLGLARLGRDAFVGWTGALVSSAGFVLANHWPPAFAAHWPALPEGVAGDRWLSVQVLALLSGFAVLALAWALAAFTLGRILLSSATGERIRRLSAICGELIRMSVVFILVSTLLDGCRALTLGSAWHRWHLQAVATLLVLPSCLVLLYARRRGWIQPFAFMTSVVLGCTLLAMMGQSASWRELGEPMLGPALTGKGWLYAAGLLNLALAAHTALRFYFGRQPILEG